MPLLDAVGPVTEINLKGTRVADAAPLANLTDLQELNLPGMRVSADQVAELKREACGTRQSQGGDPQAGPCIALDSGGP